MAIDPCLHSFSPQRVELLEEPAISALVDALRASISIPGLLPPVFVGRDVHVDGGVMNWLPVDVHGARRGRIIAVDVAGDPALLSFEECNEPQYWRFLRRRRKLPPIVAVLLRAATVSADFAHQGGARTRGYFVQTGS